ncbi:TIR domain-containing protein [Bacillus toyonensis]|uniref:TIR domain-containing protein n=1 Tax=Bacillus toyonensis TaxID=155322 RepID=UPI003D64C088
MLFGNVVNNKHKTFICYYFRDVQYYKNEFEKLFNYLFINKSVSDGELDNDLNTNYIKRLIQTIYIPDASVLIVLIGPNTHCRKHIY